MTFSSERPTFEENEGGAIPELDSEEIAKPSAGDALLEHLSRLEAKFLDYKEDVDKDREEAESAEEKLQWMHERAQERIEMLKQENKELGEAAVRDPLTKLYNRLGFEERWKEISSDLRTSDQAPRGEGDLRHCAILTIDLDLFKDVNDKYGHGAGDSVLKELARQLQENMRGRDVVARFGGEEFVVLLPGATAKDVLNKPEFGKKEGVSAHMTVSINIDGERKVDVTVSGGVTDYRTDQHESIEEALQRADALLYYAKKHGRNRIVDDHEMELEESKK
jgi:diguanylate cyclase (GGDEF)-like protein